MTAEERYKQCLERMHDMFYGSAIRLNPVKFTLKEQEESAWLIKLVLQGRTTDEALQLLKESRNEYSDDK